MKTSVFIRNATQFLQHPNKYQPERKQYVCNALEAYADKHDDVCQHNMTLVFDHIYKKLDGYYTFSAWLQDHNPRVFDMAQAHGVWAPYKQFKRLAWMEEMAQHFERQGD